MWSCKLFVLLQQKSKNFINVIMRKSLLTLVFAALTTTGLWAQGVKPLPSIHVEGKWLVDTHGNHVVLHGVMDTPSMWFNDNRWQGGYNSTGATNCQNYFEKLFKGLEQL